MKQMEEPKLPLYLQVARQIEGQIRKGALRIGDRVPSIRGLRRQQGVSVSTVLQAYFWLENQGWIEPRPQSGFYVRRHMRNLFRNPNSTFRRMSQQKSVLAACWTKSSTRSATGGMSLSATAASQDLYLL